MIVVLYFLLTRVLIALAIVALFCCLIGGVV